MPLSNKEVFYESILAELPGDIAVFDIEHRYIYVNPQAIKNPEIREWIIGKTDIEYCKYRNVDMEIATKRFEVFDKVIAEKREREWEETMLDHYGEKRHYLRRLTPVFSSFGEISFVIGYGIDITERVVLQTELDTRTGFIDKVLNTSPHLIFVKDNEGRFLLVNQAMADLFNTDIKGLIKRSNDEVHTNQEEVNDYSIVDHNVINSLKPIRRDEPFTKSDGSIIWFDTIKVPLIEQEGSVKVLGISTDITDRRIADERNRNNKERLIAAEELAKSGNWQIDYLTGVIEWSSGMYRLWEIDENLGLPTVEESYKSMYPADAIILKNAIENAKISKTGMILDFRLLLPSGIKYLRSMTKPIFSDTGDVCCLFGTVRDITIEKINEDLLRENEMRLNEVQELASMGSFSFDVASNVIHWSPASFKIFKRDPALGAPSFDEFLHYVHPEDKDFFLEMMGVLSTRDKPFEMFYRIICSDQEVKMLHIIHKPHFDDNGQIIKVVGSIADITERQKTEEILKLNEQRLVEAQELAKSGSWECDLKSGKNIWSAGHFKLWELERDLPIPSFPEFLLTIHPDDRFKVENAMKKSIRTGEEYSIEYRITTYKGNNKVMYSRALVEMDLSRTSIRIYGTVLDITERRNHEERLKLIELRLIEAQEVARFGSWQIDLKTGVAEWSDGTYKIWELDAGKPPPSLQEFYNTIDDEERERIIKIVIKSFKEGLPFDLEYKIKLSGNRIKNINARGKVERNKNGEVIRLYGTVLDITESKNFENELIQANISAGESLRTKEYFLANVSHELRTPINGVLGMARLLQKTELSSTQRSYMDILTRTADNLLVIINDILDTAKMESGKLSFDKIVFEPARVADTVVQTQLYKAEEKDLFIRHMIDASPLPAVIGDPLRLNQILLNLISNAIKFTEQGEIVLTHRIIEEDAENLTIEFSIKDTGIGIAHDEQEKIFESFTQLQGSKSNLQEGTGLGLTISRNLIERQGGKIGVVSEPGKGSTFTFYIPYKKAKEIPEVKSTERIAPGQLGALRVLLAEDNRVNQFITEAMLQDWGFKIDIASNGKEAVELIERNNYDIVLMDIQMPEMNGVEATHLIRGMKDKEKARLPIIALTANTTKQTHKKFVLEGMNDCLVKPFQEEALYKKILAHLDGKEKINATLKQPRFPVRKRPETTYEGLYNLSLLRRDARDNPNFISKMLVLFIETIPPIVDKMFDHFDKGEMDSISTLAHKIKPTLHSAGINSLKETIRNIEGYRDKKRTLEQMKNDLVKLHEIIGEIIIAFQNEINQLNNNPSE